MRRSLSAGPSGGVRLVPDVLAAAVVVLVFWAPPTLDTASPAGRTAGWALAAITGLAMVSRRRTPGAATVAAAIATVTGNALGVCQDPMLAVAWCLYPLAVARASRTRLPVLVLACVALSLAAVTGVPSSDMTGLGQRAVVAVAAVSVAWLLGTMVGRGIAATREAERARVQLEVARDVHDVVGHALGVISAEAGVTRGLADAGEQELRDSLAGIELHARRALEEVQVLVRGLRSAPPPVTRLSSVVDTTRAAGVDVRARITVDEQVEDAVGAVVLRIVQESLSNVVRHAAGAPCTVDVHETGGAVVVRVRDRGPGAAGREHTGFGLAGMSERAQLVGGSVTWGDHPGGGFEVSARLPVRRGGGR
ncbi:ATP-binding protein [Actinoplanes sp. NPDC048967]|uniref:sensor histidine kinase n=1 Tax=Actinoplanes sp. NPDC048967 TaxID=3155269 RepID=UPI0033FEACB3